MMDAKETMIAPKIESGFHRRKGTIAVGLLLQTVVFCATYFPQKMVRIIAEKAPFR